MPKSKTYVRLDVPKEIKGKKAQRDYVRTAETILKEQTVLRLYQEKKISGGTAAKMLGMPRYDFMRFLGQHRVPVFTQSDEELQADLAAAREAAELVTKAQKRRP